MVGLGFCSKTEGGSSVTCIPRGCPTPQPEASGRTGVCRPLCRACTRHRGPGTMLSASCAFECRCATRKAGRAPARCQPADPRGGAQRRQHQQGRGQGGGATLKMFVDRTQGSAVGLEGGRPHSGTSPRLGSSGHAVCPSDRPRTLLAFSESLAAGHVPWEGSGQLLFPAGQRWGLCLEGD